MKRLRKDKNSEPVRLQKKETKANNTRRINHKTLNVILLLILLFLILFVVIPLIIYSTGSLDSTNYYYRLHDTVLFLQLML